MGHVFRAQGAEAAFLDLAGVFVRELGLASTDAERAAVLLRDNFTVASFDSELPRHVHPLGLGWSGVWVENALDLASLVAAVVGARGEAAALVRRLAIGREFLGARSEARAVRALVERGFELEIARTSQAGADLCVLGADPFRVEVATVQPARESRLELSFLMALTANAHELRERRCEVHLHLGGDRLAALGAHKEMAEKAAHALAADVFAIIAAHLGSAPTIVELPGAGHAQIVPLTDRPTTPGGWSFGGRSPLGAAKKIISEIHEKAGQMAGAEGLIWFDLSPLTFELGLPPEAIVQTFRIHILDALTAGGYPNLDGVVVQQVTSANSEQVETLTLIANPARTYGPRPVSAAVLARPVVRRTTQSLAEALRDRSA